MGWKEEEQKRLLADGVERRERQRAQYKRVNRWLAVAAFGVAIVLIVDVLTSEQGAQLPMDLSDPEHTLDQWRSTGFLVSMNDTTGAVVVEDAVWNELSDDEKLTVVAFLGSYCQESIGTSEARVSIRGHTASALLAAVDSTGMIVH